jgi:putative addiction module component (TIGR02574 family)
MARIEELTKEVVNLPKEQRLALVRVLLELESTGTVAEAEQSWDDEIRARIKAVEEGRVTGIAYDDLRKEMNGRYGA